MDRPAGSPAADHEEMVAVDEESEADGLSVEMALPDTWDWVPGLVTDTVLVMFQVNAELATVSPWLSVALMVAEQVHAVVGVPLTAPELELTVTPAGRPEPDHEAMVAPAE